MKRDVDLIRKLLHSIDDQGFSGVLRSIMFNGHSEEKVRYHLRMLADSGYVKFVEKNTLGTTILRLTFNGHELVELSRDATAWQRAKQLVRERTGGESIDAIQHVLRGWALERVGTSDRWMVASEAWRNGELFAHGNGNGKTNGNGSHVPRPAKYVATNSGPVARELETPPRWTSQQLHTYQPSFENFSIDTDDPQFGTRSLVYSDGTLPIYLL